MSQSTLEFTQRLRSLMQRVNLSSFKSLAQKAGVSEWQIEQLRNGRAKQMRVENLLKVGEVLHVSINKLIQQFSDADTIPNISKITQETNEEILILQQEYERLKQQLDEQQQELFQQFQQSTLQTLETLLIQLPTATHAVQQNPDLPASRLLPLLRPIDQLLNAWGIEAIAPVGSEVPYDPHYHQLMDGTAQPGDQVRVRYTGYRQGERLLYRAKVSPK